MKVDNGSAGPIVQPQPAAPTQAAPPAAIPTEPAPKEDFTARQNAYMGRRESFASKPSVPAVQNVVAGQTFAYSPIVAGANPAAQLGAVGAPKPPASRKDLLDAMTKDIKDPAQRAKIDEGAKAYSDQQLAQMKDMGLRFKLGDGLPADRSDGFPAEIGKSNAGVYRPDKRTIQLKPNATPDEVRHELAHAWDDAKNEGKYPLRTRDDNPKWLKDGKTMALQQKQAADQAVSLRAQARAFGPPRADALNKQAAAKEKEAGYWQPGYASSDPKMVDAYEKYLKRTDAGDMVSTKTFDSAASPGHSQKNVQEFYAEGYTTFHGTGPEAEKARLKMREHAPELYAQLKQEAVEQNLPLPAEPTLVKAPSGDPLLRQD